MNKKTMIATAMSSVIVLGGATMYQQAYAAKSPVSSNETDSVVETTRSSEAALQGAPIYGSISLEEFEANNEIKIPLSLEKEHQDSAFSSSSDEFSSFFNNKILHKKYASLEDNLGTDMIDIVYATEDRSEINIYQIKSIDRNPQSAIDAQQAYFDPSFITIGDIQGHAAILEDTSSIKGGSKKQVWIATEDYYYVLHTGSPTISLNALKEIAEKINF